MKNDQGVASRDFRGKDQNENNLNKQTIEIDKMATTKTKTKTPTKEKKEKKKPVGGKKGRAKPTNPYKQ